MDTQTAVAETYPRSAYKSTALAALIAVIVGLTLGEYFFGGGFEVGHLIFIF